MTKLAWNQEGQNRYEYGVDRGVFYPSDSAGVVWNGLVSVDETSEGGHNESYHYDGIKYLDFVDPRNYQATIIAYSTPSQFRTAQGEKSIVPGFILTRQPYSVFGLSYRTFVGLELGYKIHIVYNAIASPTQRNHSTLTDSADPDALSWRINAVPPVGYQHRPSAHYILDSITAPPGALEALEDIIYGSDTTPARLPDFEELIDMIALWAPLYILAQPSSGLSQLMPGTGDLYRSKLAGFQRALPQTKLYPSPIKGLYRLE